jgi:hypothetical protein
MVLAILITSSIWTLILIHVSRISYHQGIWDGAFNHFLPVVRKQMLYYDEHRAQKIFEAEENG